MPPISSPRQVVVVGASEAGLAAVERMLLDPLLAFNYITLLAPVGAHTQCWFTRTTACSAGNIWCLAIRP
jgi:hypothetical protein